MSLVAVDLYIRVKVLGRGAFGEAVLYRKPEDNSLVVWKEINLARLSERGRKDVQTEIDVLSLLNHANICGYFNHFIHENMLYIELEYANGGSLYHAIVAQNNELFSEETALWYIYQIAVAFAYIHEKGIIHRDVKTLNIFTTKADILKIGDFGMAKMLENEEMAHTMTGTPYYLSPEVIKGEPYNSKSDIWAIGCVFHEILTLKRTFEATNTLALAAQIVRGKFADIDKRYSVEISSMLRRCLEMDQMQRASAQEILCFSVLKLKERDFRQRLKEHSGFREELSVSHSDMIAAKPTRTLATDQAFPVVAAATTELYTWGGKTRTLKVEQFRESRSALQVAVGGRHAAVVTIEKELYTWMVFQESGSQPIHGELGHGDGTPYKQPKLVSAFQKVAIANVACGEDFTCCIADATRQLFTFGCNEFGCLAVGMEVQYSFDPQRITFFDERPVAKVSCGQYHVLALTVAGELFAWGSNEYGKLGIGNEVDQAVPYPVPVAKECRIVSMCCGNDGSFTLTSSGRILACGSNEDNKLGFYQNIQGVTKDVEITYDIPYETHFRLVKPLRKHFIVAMAMGSKHAAVLDDTGRVLTFGNNENGQLGQGDFKVHKQICHIKALSDKHVTNVACGDSFTIACTSDNHIFAWGNGQNGRLSFSLLSASGKEIASTASPRPVFGSLHRTCGISCYGWTTFIITEQILSQTTLRPATPGTVGFDFLNAQQTNKTEQLLLEKKNEAAAAVDIYIVDSGRTQTSKSIEETPLDQHRTERSTDLQQAAATAETSGKSVTPAWLQKEIDDAECIAKTDVFHNSRQGNIHKAHLNEQPESKAQKSALPAGHDESGETVGQLLCQIAQLKAENEEVCVEVMKARNDFGLLA